MIISTAITWQSVDWPVAGTPATEYAIFLGSATNPLQTVTDITATVTYDDTTTGAIFLIRPTDGTSYGPAQSVFVGNGPMNNRGWFRSYIRNAISDRIDTNPGNAPSIADNEIDGYLNDALRKYSGYFPRERTTTITLEAMKRDYPLPQDFMSTLALQYQPGDQRLKLWLREEPYKGGESTPTSYVGYPKLGIFQPAWGGRLYSGHFEVHDNDDGTKTVTLDFDPSGESDTLILRYRAFYAFPTDDLVSLGVPDDDLEGLSLYVQAKCWTQVEARDVLLSRFRSREDGSRRDDLPTEKMSTRMFNAWQTWVSERQSLHPRNIRIVRRT